MKWAVSQTLICTTADDILVFEKKRLSYTRLPIFKITTFGSEKENVRGISGCD
jgi:hypothetical protein